MTSTRPYGIAFDYTDNAREFASLTFTSVEVVYDDGGREGSVDSLGLPIEVRSREYESVNSMSGGRIVRSTVRVLSGQMRGVITRDESIVVRIAGHFTRTDGGVFPFEIEQRWEVEVERGTKSAAEVLQDR